MAACSNGTGGKTRPKNVSNGPSRLSRANRVRRAGGRAAEARGGSQRRTIPPGYPPDAPRLPPGSRPSLGEALSPHIGGTWRRRGPKGKAEGRRRNAKSKGGGSGSFFGADATGGSPVAEGLRAREAEGRADAWPFFSAFYLRLRVSAPARATDYPRFIALTMTEKSPSVGITNRHLPLLLDYHSFNSHSLFAASRQGMVQKTVRRRNESVAPGLPVHSVSHEICVRKLRMISRVENAVTNTKPALQPANNSFNSLRRFPSNWPGTGDSLNQCQPIASCIVNNHVRHLRRCRNSTPSRLRYPASKWRNLSSASPI